MSKRDPFGYPKLENDFTLSGFKPEPKKTFDKPTHIAHNEEPWSGLHEAATSSSNRRGVCYHEQQASTDSLDLHLNSVYDHHMDLFQGKNKIIYQKETASGELGTQGDTEQQEVQDKDITMWIDPQKRSIHSIDKY